jgi:thiol-disulfide isomerase/thioredoxin
MMIMKKVFSFSLFISLSLCGSLLTAALAQQAGAEDEITINLRGVDGKMYDIASMRGNVLLVSFGATWCVPCADELRILEQLQKEYEGKPVKFMWVSLEGEDEVSDKQLKNFAKKLKLTFPVLRDPTKFTFAQFADTVRIPLVTIFNKEGRLVVRQTGMETPEKYKTAIRQRIDKFLAASASANSTGVR